MPVEIGIIYTIDLASLGTQITLAVAGCATKTLTQDFQLIWQVKHFKLFLRKVVQGCFTWDTLNLCSLLQKKRPYFSPHSRYICESHHRKDERRRVARKLFEIIFLKVISEHGVTFSRAVSQVLRFGKATSFHRNDPSEVFLWSCFFLRTMFTAVCEPNLPLEFWAPCSLDETGTATILEQRELSISKVQSFRMVTTGLSCFAFATLLKLILVSQKQQDFVSTFSKWGWKGKHAFWKHIFDHEKKTQHLGVSKVSAQNKIWEKARVGFCFVN